MMTLQHIHNYLSPFVGNPIMMIQPATLIVHLPDGDIMVRLRSDIEADKLQCPECLKCHCEQNSEPESMSTVEFDADFAFLDYIDWINCNPSATLGDFLSLLEDKRDEASNLDSDDDYDIEDFERDIRLVEQLIDFHGTEYSAIHFLNYNL